MLNSSWIKFDEQSIKKDLADWDKVVNTLPAVYPFQFQIIDNLLDKYYRTEKGNSLNPKSLRVTRLAARIEMLQRTMQALETAINYRNQERAETWELQSDAEKDPVDILLREDEKLKDREVASISSRDVITADAEEIKFANLGRLWLAPNEHGVFSVSKNMQHADWMEHHLKLLTQEEIDSAIKHKSDPDHLAELASMLFKDGWTRISGYVCQLYSPANIPNLSRFIKRSISPLAVNNSIQIVFDNGEEPLTMKISELIENHGGSELRVASISSRDAETDTIKYWDKAKNKDFSKYWRKIKKKKKKAEISISSRHVVAKSGASYEWSCLMVDYPSDTVSKVIKWGKENITEDKLHIDDDPTASGLEDHIHTTVCYGIGPEISLDDIKSKCKLGSLDISLGKIGKFEKDNYDVIKIDVDSKDLHDLHKEIEDKIGAPGNTYPDYKPHVTIAYVKSGSCDDLVGQSPFEGEKFVINKYDFSPADGEHVKHVASVPNPLRNNFDYGMSWEERVRRINRKRMRKRAMLDPVLLAEYDEIPNDSNWQNQTKRNQLGKRLFTDTNPWADLRML